METVNDWIWSEYYLHWLTLSFRSLSLPILKLVMSEMEKGLKICNRAGFKDDFYLFTSEMLKFNR